MRTYSKSLFCLIAFFGLTSFLVAQDNGLDAVIAPGAKLEKVASGFQFTEGPIVDKKGDIYFTDQPNNRIMKWDSKKGISVFLEPAGRANGMFFDKDMNIWACADEKNELWKISPDKKIEKVVGTYEGLPFNGPNDLWITSTGGIFFSDPFFKRDYWDAEHQKKMPQAIQAVYYMSPDHKKVTRVVDDMKQPNGIVGTPDGKNLFISDMGGNKTWEYTLSPDGSLTNKRLFCEMGGDGMTIDTEGNIYLCKGGVNIFDKTGKKLGTIKVPEGWTANLCFGDKDLKSLYITASKSLYKIRLKVKGTRG